MSYGLRYTSLFDSFKPLQGYVIDIYKKDYTGEADDFLVGETPVVQEWQDDDPKMPIRGCTLKVSIITDENGLRLKDFYSEDDNEYKCIFRDAITGVDLFSGFLLQDECAEILVDFNHEIQLTFTDQLGILKDITLDLAAVVTGTATTINNVDFYKPFIVIQDKYIASTNTAVAGLKPGDKFVLFDGSNTYELTCYGLSLTVSNEYYIDINQPCPITGTVTFQFTYITPYNLNGYIPLIDVLSLCIRSTQLSLPFTSLVNIYPKNGTNQRIWDDTFVDAATFFDGEVWQDCYTILENLMARFNACLFQAYNRWYIIRWDEMYKYTTTAGATIPGHNYDVDFNYVSAGGITQNFDFFNKSDLETGVIGSISRPYQYVKETFNYVQNTDLPCNRDLQKLGDLLNEYATGTLIHKEYGFVDFYDGPFAPHPTRYIRVVYDNDPTSDKYTQEIERYAVITGNTGDNPRGAKSCDIPISKGDSIEISFSFKTNVSEPGPINLVFAISVTDGTNTYYLHYDTTWQTTLGYAYSIGGGDNLNEWHSIQAGSKGCPIDGNLNVYLATITSNPADESHYKDINLNIKYVIDGSGRVVGHTHTDTNLIETKNNNEKEIYFDDSPSNSINGTLFLESYNGVLRNRCTFWTYPSAPYEYENLGKGITQELLLTRYKPRTKYEGTLLYTKTGAGPYKFITPLSVFLKYDEKPYYRFIVGKLAINYKTATCDFTLYEHLDNMGGDFNGTVIQGILIPGIQYQYFVWVQDKIYEFSYIFDKR